MSLRWFTTKLDEWVSTDLVGLYGKFDEYHWIPLVPDSGRREKDEKMFEQLKAKTEERMLEHLKATTKRRPGH